MALVPASTAILGEREVDFYRNPTELFRWVNYRRWEGAENRAQTCPEEVKTWIVSTDQNTNQVQWRHLPLHLCCMQSQIPVALIETMIRIYPEATEMQDHEGMTPLHLACFKGGISDQVATILMSSHPGAVCTTDKHNRTPFDLLQLSITSGVVMGADVKQVSLMMNRTELFLTGIKASVRDEEVQRLNVVHAGAAKERVATQQVISRMEGDLEKAKETIETMASELENKDELEGDLEHRLVNLQKQLNDGLEEREQLESKIEDLKSNLNQQSTTLHGRDDEVEHARIAMRAELGKMKEELDAAQSENATSKSMAEALEQQLKSKFAGEYSHSSKIRELELSISEAAVNKNVMETEYNNKIDALNRELTRAKDNVEELTKYNLSLQSKMKDLSDSVSKVLASQNIMSAEQDRLVDNCRKYEADMTSLMEEERSRLASLVERQRGVMDDLLDEQKRIMSSGSEAASQLRETISAERERCFASINKMKQEFDQAQAVEREQKQQEASRRANAKVPLPQLSIPSPRHVPGIGNTASISSPRHVPGIGNTASISSPRPNNLRIPTPRQASSPSMSTNLNTTPRQASPSMSGNLSRMIEQRKSLDVDDCSSAGYSREDSTSSSGRVFVSGNSFDQHWSGQTHQPSPTRRTSTTPKMNTVPPTTPRSSGQIPPTTPRSGGLAPPTTPRSNNAYHTPRSNSHAAPRSILQSSPRRPNLNPTTPTNRVSSPKTQVQLSSDAQASLRSKPSLFDQRQDIGFSKARNSRQVGFSEH
jgi:hypothetical protein